MQNIEVNIHEVESYDIDYAAALFSLKSLSAVFLITP